MSTETLVDPSVQMVQIDLSQLVYQNFTDYLTNPDRYFWFLVIVDCLYPFIMVLQRFLMGSFPGKRFRKTLADNVAIFTHILFGMISMYSLMAVFFVQKYGDGTWVQENPTLVRLIALSTIVQCTTALYLVPGVHGEQIITRPLYVGLAGMCLFDSWKIIETPSYANCMYLWTAINGFMFIRLYYLTLAFYTFIDRKLLYTFSVAACFLSPMVGQHDLVWISVYALPAFYGIFVFLDRSLPRQAIKDQIKANLMAPGTLGSQPRPVVVKPKKAKTPQQSTALMMAFAVLLFLATIGMFAGCIVYLIKIKDLDHNAKAPLTSQELQQAYPTQTLSPLPPDFLSTGANDDVNQRTHRMMMLGANQKLYEFGLDVTAAYQNKSANAVARALGQSEEKANLLFGAMGGPVGEQKRVLDKSQFYVDFILPHQALNIMPVVNQTLAQIPFTFSMGVNSLSDYDQLFNPMGFPMPGQNSTAIMNDAIFGQEQLTFGGMMIQRIYDLPTQMRGQITPEMVAGIMPAGVASLPEAMQKGLVYSSDVSFMDTLDPQEITAPLLLTPPNPTHKRKYAPGSIGIFVLHNTTAQPHLMPVAIWIGGGSNLVYTPRDNDQDWVLAKIFFSHALKTAVHVRHILLDHLLLEPQVTAAMRQMSDVHPVHALLMHHARLGVGINEFMGSEFLAENKATPSSLDQILGVGSIGVQRMISREYDRFDYDSSDPLKDFAFRDVMELPQYLYRDDTIALYKAIENFVRKFVGIYYPNDQAVMADVELQGWAREVASTNGGRVKGFPGQLQRVDEVVRVLARFVWRNSAHHASVGGDMAYEYMAHPGSYVAAIYRAPPKAKGMTSSHDILSMLPTPEQLVYQIAILRLHKRPLLAEDSLMFSYEKAGLGTLIGPAISQWQQDMKALSDSIRARKQSQIASGYPAGFAYGLDPAEIPYWPWL